MTRRRTRSAAHLADGVGDDRAGRSAIRTRPLADPGGGQMLAVDIDDRVVDHDAEGDQQAGGRDGVDRRAEGLSTSPAAMSETATATQDDDRARHWRRKSPTAEHEQQETAQRDDAEIAEGVLDGVAGR